MRPGRLFVGPVDERFDAERDLALGPWCFLGRETLVPGWEDLSFVEPFADGERQVEAKALLLPYAEALMRALAPEFNRRHGVEHSIDYWRLLLVPWLLGLPLQVVWKRLHHIQAFIERHRDRVLEAELFDADLTWPHADLLDLHDRIAGSHEFNWWLNSLILRRLAPPHWTLRSVTADLSGVAPRPRPPAPTGWRRVRSWLRDRYYDQRCRRVYGIVWLSPLVSAVLALLPPKPRRTRIPPPPLSALEARMPPLYPELVRDVIWRLLPDSLDKGYAAWEAWAGRRRYRKGRIQLLGPVIIFNDDAKFVLAHAAEAGELLVCTQHGGSGYQRIMVNSAEMEYKQDAYLTWGWTEEEDDEGRFVPVPSPLYSRFRDRHREQEASLILVGTSMRAFGPRLETTLQPSDTIRYRRDKRAFIEGLAPAARRALLYRPYVGDVGCFEDEAWLRRHLPDLAVLDGDLHGRLQRCRLLAVDHYGTTFGMGMAANTPSIGFWDPAVWEICRQAVPIFEQLRAAGIVHATPQSAAAHVGRVWDDVAGWWQASETQAARRAFCQAYGRTSRFPVLGTLAALVRL